MSKLIEKRKEFEAKQKKIMKVFEDAGQDLDLMKCTELTGKDGKERAEEIKRLNKELEDLGVEVDSLAAVEDAASKAKLRQDRIVSGGQQIPQPGQPEEKTLGRMFVESAAYKAYKEHGLVKQPAILMVDLKATFARDQGWAPQSIRTGKVVEYATRPIQIIDLIPSGRTSEAAVVYMEETSFVNAAAAVPERTGTLAEATLALTERSSTVRDIGVLLPATKQQLRDVDGIESYINNRLGFMLRQHLDNLLINGDGVAPNLQGLLALASIQVEANGGDVFLAFANALRKVKVTGRANPNVWIINPADWWSDKLRLKKTDTGEYVMGNPSEPGPTRVWGLPVVEADVIAAGTSATGDFPAHSQLFERQGIELEITDSHDTHFAGLIYDIRATIREAICWYRGPAFCKVTGI